MSCRLSLPSKLAALVAFGFVFLGFVLIWRSWRDTRELTPSIFGPPLPSDYSGRIASTSASTEAQPLRTTADADPAIKTVLKILNADKSPADQMRYRIEQNDGRPALEGATSRDGTLLIPLAVPSVASTYSTIVFIVAPTIEVSIQFRSASARRTITLPSLAYATIELISPEKAPRWSVSLSPKSDAVSLSGGWTARTKPSKLVNPPRKIVRILGLRDVSYECRIRAAHSRLEGSVAEVRLPIHHIARVTTVHPSLRVRIVDSAHRPVQVDGSSALHVGAFSATSELSHGIGYPADGMRIDKSQTQGTLFVWLADGEAFRKAVEFPDEACETEVVCIRGTGSKALTLVGVVDEPISKLYYENESGEIRGISTIESTPLGPAYALREPSRIHVFLWGRRWHGAWLIHKTGRVGRCANTGVAKAEVTYGLVRSLRPIRLGELSKGFGGTQWANVYYELLLPLAAKGHDVWTRVDSFRLGKSRMLTGIPHDWNKVCPRDLQGRIRVVSSNGATQFMELEFGR